MKALDISVDKITSQDIARYKKELKTLKLEKGKLSKTVGELKKSGATADKEIADLAVITSNINDISKLIKSSLNMPTTVQQKPDETVSFIKEQDATEFTKLKDKEATKVIHFDGATEMAAKIDHFVSQHPQGTIYHKSSLFYFIDKTFNHNNAFLIALDEEETVVGVLPLVQLKSRLFGNFIVSVPYFNYGGVLANNSNTVSALTDEASRWKDELNASHIEYRHVEKDLVELPARTDKVTFLLPLPNSSEELWQSFKSKLRSQIKRSSRLSPEIKMGGEELIDDFYQVFSINMRDLGTPVYGKDFFINALACFGDAASLVVVYIDGKAVGCAFLLGFGKTLEIPWASTLKELNPQGLNMTMYWAILQFAIQQGYSCFDFGRCTVDCGTYQFKKQWGAHPVPFYWHYQLPEGDQLPQLNPNNPKFKLLVAIWKRLPVSISRLIGPHIVKYLP